MVSSALFASSIALAAGHGHLTFPPSTRHGASLATAGQCSTKAGHGACFWFSNNVEIPGEETLPVEARSVTNGGSPDVFGTAPWRAPGTAPVYGSGCGMAGGGPVSYANGGIPPPGVAQGLDGLELAEMKPTVWQIGSVVDVAWAISANHGGGYQYRLCKKSDGVSEECFQKTQLKFSGNTSFIVDHNGVIEKEFPMTKVVIGGNEWARDPIPGCKTCEDARATCGAPLAPVPMNETGGKSSDPWDTQVNCYGLCCGAGSSKAHGVCPDDTEFYPPVSGHSGFGKDVPDWSMMDRVVIPDELEAGEYLLGWRWDCEESTQVWQNCADLVLTEDAPPATTTPVPSPSPSPSPKPSKYTCKQFENPKCSAFTKNCAIGGCSECTDETTFNCNTCCPGCEMASKGGVTYCTESSTVV